MSNNNARQNLSYGFSQALLNVFPAPILSQRVPNTSDKAQLGQMWVDVPTNAIYILTSIVNNLANWQLLETGGGAGVFTSLTVTPGPISLTGTTTINTAGAATTSIGTGGTGAVNIGNTTGNTSVTGTLTATSNITSSAGQLITTNGAVSIGNTAASASGSNAQFLKSRTGGVITTGDTLGNIIFAGYDGTAYTTGAAIVSTTSGTIAATRIPSDLEFYTHADAAGILTKRLSISTAGNVVVAAADSGISLNAADLTVSAGNFTVSIGTASVLGTITSTTGNIISTLGNVKAGTNLYTAGDDGTGLVTTTSFTNVTNTSQSTGTLAIKSTTANPGNNAGFLKIYVGTVSAFVPYFTNIAP